MIDFIKLGVGLSVLTLLVFLLVPDYEAYKAGEYRQYKSCDRNAVVCYFTREYE